MKDFQDYMKDQLKRFIIEEQRKGIPLEQIEQSLLDAGHKKNVIDECFDELKKQEVGLTPEEPQGQVQKDTVSQIKSSIEKFFGQLQGQEVDKVKKSFKKEPTEEIVEEAIEEYEVEEEKYILEGFYFFIFIVGLSIFTLFIAGSTSDEVLTVAMGLAPAFVNCFISFAMVKFANYVPIFMLIPIVIGGGFFALGTFADIEVFNRMEIESLAIVNTVISMFFNIILVAIKNSKPEPMHKFPRKNKKQENVDKSQEYNSPSPQVHREDKKSKKHIDDLKKEFGMS